MPPQAGHGVKIFVELDPEGSPGEFTRILGLNTSVDTGYMRDSEEITPHDRLVDVHIIAPIMKRDDLSLTLNYDVSDPDHVALYLLFKEKKIFGLRRTGPGQTAGAEIDELIWSGGLKAFKIKNPVRTGVYAADLVFRASDNFIDDGVEYGEN